MEEIEELCKRVYIIDLGKEIAYGDREEIKASVFSNNKVIIQAQDINGATIMKLRNIEGINKVTDKEDEIALTIGSKFKLGNVLQVFEEDRAAYQENKL